MYASVRRYETSAPEVMARRVSEGLVPVLSKAPGFVAYYGLVTEEGAWLSVSIFADRSGAEDSDRKAAEWTRDHLSDLLIGPPEIDAGEIAVYEPERRLGREAA